MGVARFVESKLLVLRGGRFNVGPRPGFVSHDVVVPGGARRVSHHGNGLAPVCLTQRLMQQGEVDHTGTRVGRAKVVIANGDPGRVDSDQREATGCRQRQRFRAVVRRSMKHRDKLLGAGMHVPGLADQRVAVRTRVGTDQKRRAAVNLDSGKLPQHILKIGEGVREENILDRQSRSVGNTTPLFDHFRAVLLMNRKMHPRELHTVLARDFDTVLAGKGRCQVEADFRQLANLFGKECSVLQPHFVRSAGQSNQFQHGKPRCVKVGVSSSRTHCMLRRRRIQKARIDIADRTPG